MQIFNYMSWCFLSQRVSEFHRTFLCPRHRTNLVLFSLFSEIQNPSFIKSFTRDIQLYLQIYYKHSCTCSSEETWSFSRFFLDDRQILFLAIVNTISLTWISLHLHMNFVILLWCSSHILRNRDCYPCYSQLPLWIMITYLLAYSNK